MSDPDTGDRCVGKCYRFTLITALVGGGSLQNVPYLVATFHRSSLVARFSRRDTGEIEDGEERLQEAKRMSKLQAAISSCRSLWYFDYYRGYSRRLDFLGSSEMRGLFLRLLEKICDGCYIEINEAATKLKYKPGIAMGGKNLAHDCGVSCSNWLFLGTAARSCFIWEEGPGDQYIIKNFSLS